MSAPDSSAQSAQATDRIGNPLRCCDDHEVYNPDCARGLGEYVAANGLWLTAGEVIEHLSQFPAEMPVTVMTPDGGGWYNTPGMSDPRETDESSVIFYTSDDFDTRQF